MKLHAKHDWGHTWYEAKKKNCKITIDKHSNGKWYFYLDREKDDLKYNSLWENKDYDSLENCVEVIEEWLKNNA